MPSVDRPSPSQSIPSGSKGTYRPYTIKGQTYRPLRSAHGYVEQGIASWYGSDFHGKATANGEQYDMHAMTAAHRTLPMNTKVQVTNLRNGKQATLRINDRGPFAKNRVLDLSYAGAKRLGVVGPGTAPVRIKAVGTSPRQVRGRFYIQTGSFRERRNAQEQLQKLRNRGYKNSRIVQATTRGTRVWRVQAGVFPELEVARSHRDKLEGIGSSCFILAD
ncbi:MAG: septal ring lytic transglycosylase RlpA family protein [Thermodesulfobacteriota bacterium]